MGNTHCPNKWWRSPNQSLSQSFEKTSYNWKTVHCTVKQWANRWIAIRVIGRDVGWIGRWGATFGREYCAARTRVHFFSVNTSKTAVNDALQPIIRPFLWNASYIHACIQTLLVGKRHRDVHYVDAQSHLRQATKQRDVPSFCQPICLCARTMCNLHIIYNYSWERFIDATCAENYMFTILKISCVNYFWFFFF